MIPKPDYGDGRPHKIWIRLGTMEWQGAIAIDGKWIMATSMEIKAEGAGYNHVVISIPLIDFEIEGGGSPELVVRDSNFKTVTSPQEA